MSDSQIIIVYNNGIAMSVSTFLSFFFLSFFVCLPTTFPVLGKWLEAPIQGKGYKL